MLKEENRKKRLEAQRRIDINTEKLRAQFDEATKAKMQKEME